MRARGNEAVTKTRVATLLLIGATLLLAAVPLAAQSNGRLVFSNGSTTPQNNTYSASTNAFTAGPGMTLGAGQTWMVDRACPTRTEHLAGYVTTGGVLYIYRFDGTAWIEVTNTAAPAGWGVGTRPTVGGAGVNGRRFDIAYEQVTGRCVVIYSANAAGTNNIRYRIWDGSTWTAATNLTASQIPGAAVNYIRTATRSGSNQIAMAVADATSPALLSALLWSGTAWGNEPAAALTNVVYQSAAPGDVPSFDIAFESSSGHILIVNSINGGNNLNYHQFTGGAWSTATLAAGTARAYGALTLAANPDATSNQILIAATRSVASNSGGTYYAVWSGTAWSTLTTGGTMSASYAINRLPIAAGWLRSGTTTAGVVAYSTATVNRIDYYYTVNGGTNWTAANDTTITAAAQARYWWNASPDPVSPDRMMVTFSDAASDLWAKRLVLSAGPTFTWSNADGGTAETTTLASLTTRNFAFAYDRTNPNATVAGTVTTAQATGATPSITVTAPYSGDANGNNTLSYRYQVTGSGLWSTPAALPHSTSPYTFTISGLTCGTSYDIEVTYVDSDGLSGTNPQTVTITPTNCTTAGTATASSTTCTGITISAPYTNDANTNNTLSYRTRTPSATGTWTAATAVGHSTNPYSVPITGLTFAATYDVEVTYVDADGVSGTAVQTVSNITVGANCTAAGTATAAQTAGATPSIAISAPYTGDANGNNTLSYRYRTPTGTGAWTAATPVAHSASPYAVTISGLACGSSYDVEVTYLDASDGIGSGTAVQTISNIILTNCTVTGGVSATGGSCGSIALTAPYTQDADGDNTLSYRYRTPTGTGTWTAAIVVAHSATPYSFNITGLAAGTYDVEVTYADADGVTGTNPRTVTNITVSATCTQAGTVTVAATSGSCTSLTVTAPYTGDTNGSNSLSYRYRTPSGTGTWTTPVARPHSTSPYSFAISPLTANTVYDVEVTYVDADGVAGTAVQTVVAVSTGDCRVTPGAATAAVTACNQIVVSAPFTGDANLSSTTAISRGTAAGGPWTAVCSGVIGASPRICTDNGVTGSSTYYYQVTFTDTADGVVGTNPQVIGPYTTTACAVNTTTPGAATASFTTCTTATVTATFTGDDNNNGYFTVESGPSATGPWTAFAGQASGPSPRQLVVTGLTASTAYWFRVTFYDIDNGGTISPPIVTGASITTPACGTDTVAPTVTMLSPTEGALISGIETIRAQVYEAVGLAASNPVQYQVDGGVWTVMSINATYPSCGTNCATYTATQATALGAGPHALLIRATDAAGNATVVATGFKATAAGTGTGTLLRRTHGSELCVDCHALATHNSQNTSTNYGSWSFDCLACHTPHKTTNIYLVKTQINTPNSGPKSVSFYNTAGVAANSFGTPTGSGNGVGMCEVCHTKTKNSDGTARARNNAATDWTKHYSGNCVGCHPHGKGFAAGESEGSANCSGCHSTIWNKMQGAGASAYKHGLAVDTFTDDSVAWSSPLNGNAASVRSCVNMCHDDHPHTATDDPNPTQHYNLAYDDSASNASRAATTRTVATKAKIDFDNSLAGGGMCLSCHKNPVESGLTPTHPAIAQANYNASAHNTTSVTTYTPGAAPAHRASATATGTTATLTINKPTGTVQGDLMIANIAWSTGTTNNSNPPTLAGWTRLTDVDGTSTNPYRHACTLWRVAGASEGASYAFAISGTASAWVVTGAISSFSGADLATPIGAVGTHQWNNTASTTNTAPGITTPYNNCVVLFCSGVGVTNAAHSAWTTATAGALTEIYDSTLTAAMNVGGAILVDTTAGATGNGTVTISSAVAAGVLIAINPVLTTVPTPWAYTLHDGSNFTRNCTKCHWDSADGTTPTVANKSAIGAVHGSSNPSLLMGTTNPAAAPAGFICYRCHGGGVTGSDYSGKAVYQDGTKTYKHPMDGDTVHNSSTEFYNAAWGNTLGVTGRHSNCQDCHDPHEAQKSIKQGTVTASTTTTLTDSAMSGRWTASGWVGSLLYVPSLAAGQNTRAITASTAAGVLTVAAWATAPAVGASYYILDNKADGALQGAWGAALSSNPALWTAPGSANFTKQTMAAGSSLQATLCFKCHSSYYWGAGTPPNGVSPNGTAATPVETDVAMEFNPNNKSGHPVLASLNNFAGSVAPKPLAAAQMVAPWNVNLGSQTMSCGDCHNTDAASPAAQGPHGSAVIFMIKNGAAKPGWPTASATAAGFTTTFCSTCHVNANVHTRDGGHAQCYLCHIVIPHGGKMSRLMGDRDATSAMPARYAYNNDKNTMVVQSFTKAATDGGYQTSNCQATCTGTHGTAAAENW